MGPLAAPSLSLALDFPKNFSRVMIAAWVSIFPRSITSKSLVWPERVSMISSMVLWSVGVARAMMLLDFGSRAKLIFVCPENCVCRTSIVVCGSEPRMLWLRTATCSAVVEEVLLSVCSTSTWVTRSRSF